MNLIDEEDREEEKKKNFYFDEKKAQELIRKKDEDPKAYEELILMLDKLCLAVINKYHFFVDGYTTEDLKDYALIQCIESLNRFDLSKARQKNKAIFSYFSLVAKKSIILLINRSKKGKTCSFDEVQNIIEAEDKYEIDNNEETFYYFINKIEKMEKQLKGCYKEMAKVLKNNINKIKNKKDLVKFFLFLGFDQMLIKSFLKKIKQMNKNQKENNIF